jgi:hypothetical protein
MKFNEILKEAQLGKELYESTKSSEEILNLYDKDYKIFSVSQRIKELSEGMTEDKATLSTVDKLSKALSEIEQREMKILQPSSAYYKMKLPSIVESYNTLIQNFDDKKYYTKIDKTKFGKLLASVSFSVEHIAEEAGKEAYTKNTPLVLEDTFDLEKELIEEIVK